MDIREKTAFISTLLNLSLTIFKFILFYFTGSLAILAEAWHSFSDIGTSVLVYNAVRLNKDKDNKSSRITCEHYTSLGIGIFLLIISLSLLYKLIISQKAPIQGTLISGILFLLFSIGSYFVYKFESKTGIEEKSPALIADGLHSKADMVGALLTGFSLILYSLGIDIDKPIAFFMTLFILSFAIECIIQFLNPKIRKDPGLAAQNPPFSMITSLFKPEFISKLLSSADKFLGMPSCKYPKIKDAIKKYYFFVILITFILCYASTSIVTLGIKQEGVLLRFNKIVNTKASLGPGIHFKLPWPIEKIIKTNTKEIRQMHIGNISDTQSFALLWTKEHGTGEPFLSGDNNYFHPYIILHYRINNIYDFNFLHNNPEDTLNNIANRIITKLFAANTFDDIATKLRGQLNNKIKNQVQMEINNLKIGIELLSVNMIDTHPPIFIADSFEKVIASLQEKQGIINAAHSYRNQRLPEARGKSVKQISNANAYNIEKEHHATGDSSRFLQKLKAFRKNSKVNKIWLYLKEIESSLSNKNLIIIDPKAGAPKMWMGFSDIPPYTKLNQGDIVKGEK